MPKADPPTVSAIIPTKNRWETLSRVITALLQQTLPLDILVMDDASTDGTPEKLRTHFPQVQHHRESTSLGPGHQRNKGARLARTDFILTIDDDCVLASPRIVEQTLAQFTDPRIAAVTLPFINVLQEDRTIRCAAPDSDPQTIHVGYEYYGGMIAFRRQAYLDAGGYRPYLFMHVEEPDLAIRLYNLGHVIRLGTADPLEHLESPVRNRPRLHRLGPRNHVLYTWWNVPMPYFPVHLAGTTLRTFLFGFRIPAPGLVTLGLLQGYWGILHELFRRRPVTLQTYRRIRQLKARGHLTLEELLRVY